MGITPLLVVGSTAGFTNVMSGGGSTLGVPTLLFLVIDAATANGTNRGALLIECIAGIRSFHDQ